jgi:putative nucleotidyltransferase with HDIG domain
VSGGERAARAALAGRRAWLVGGVLRDRALGLQTADVDVAVEGDPAEAARAVARAASGAACFLLSEEFEAWRVAARDSSWQVDVQRLRGGSVEADLGLRDFTVNAIAEPIDGGALIDPLGGLADLAARRLRMTSPAAFGDDALRVLRLSRVASELDLEPEPQTLSSARAHAAALRSCPGERVFLELRRIVSAPEVLRGLELLEQSGATEIVLPELESLRGVEQSRFHHLDVYEHTLEVLRRSIALAAACGGDAPDPGEVLGEHRAQVAALLAEPLADGLTRADALRWGALLHDAAKPLTRAVGADGRVTFIGHDSRGAELARAVLGRLRASERLSAHVAALVRHHLRLGFLVHEPQPLSRRAVFGYLRATSPVEVDVTLLSVADRQATRGERARQSIDLHMRVARDLLADALSWRAAGPPSPLVRGDELAAALGIPPGPRLGELLEELSEAHYAGDIATREQALEYVRGRAPGGSREESQ